MLLDQGLTYISHLYVSIIGSIICCLFFLQISYSLSSYGNIHKNCNSTNYNSSVRCSIRHLITNISIIEPDLSLSTTLLLGTYTSYLICMHFLSIIQSSRFQTPLIFLMNYIKDPIQESAQISLELDRIIDQVILSNLNHAQTMRKNFWRENLVGGNPASSYASNKLSMERRRQSSQRPRLLSFAIMKADTGEYQTQLILLSDQLDYLEKLKNDKSSIWPSNRNTSWAKTISFIRNALYFTLAINVYICTIYATYHILQVYHNYRIAKNIHHPRTFARSLFLINLMSIPHLCNHVSTTDFSGQMIAMVDLVKLSNDPCLTINRFLNYASRMRLYLSMDPVNISDNVLRDIRSDCDRLATKAYIQMRYFLLRSEYLMKQFSTATAKTMIPPWVVLVLGLFTDYNKEDMAHELHLAVPIMVIFGAVINLGLSFHAYVSKRLKKNFMKSVSLYGCLTEVFHEGNKSSYPGESGQTKDVANSRRTITSHHTSELWFRLIADEPMVSKKLAIHIFGALKINYKFVIQLNILSTSVCMFSLIYK